MVVDTDFDANVYRAQFDQFIGALIDSVIGGSRISHMFDGDDDASDVMNDDRPAGRIVLDLGIVSEDTKTALLIAQAAERTARLAEKAMDVIGYGARIKYIGRSDFGFISHDDPVFKYVGSINDHEYLRTAQASWQIAQIYLNQVINNNVLDAGDVNVGPLSCYGLMLVAAQGYKNAAEIIRGEGHEHVADNMDAVSSAIVQGVAPGEYPDCIAVARNIVTFYMLHSIPVGGKQISEEELEQDREVLLENVKRLMGILS